MKKFPILATTYCSVLMTATMVSSAFADVCPDPADIKVTALGDGFVVSQAPEKYVYRSALVNYALPATPIRPEKLGPIEFIAVHAYGYRQIRKDVSYLTASSYIQCVYGVAKDDASTTYTGGFFYLDVVSTKSKEFEIDMNFWKRPSPDSALYVCGAVDVERPGENVDRIKCEFKWVTPSNSSLKTKRSPKKQIAK